MAQEKQAVICFMIIVTMVAIKPSSPQIINNTGTICENVHIYRNATHLKQIQNCSVIVGYLKLVLIENTTGVDFEQYKAPLLKEVTGFVLIYRVNNLVSLGTLFPNLARIRGHDLIDNYALVVYDMFNLREIGLYSLLQIDRGGVYILGGPLTCFVHTVDWKTIAPKSRHVINPTGNNCNMQCSCSRDVSRNNCWNIRKCQRFLSGPESETCHQECLGCRLTNKNECTLCRNYTYDGKCVSKCPNGTLILPENQYCLTKEACLRLNRWPWDQKCISQCPFDYKIEKIGGETTCKECYRCDKTCPSLRIQNLYSIQNAGKCVYINGSLTIHLRAIPEGMDELRKYLSRIEEVSDYIQITRSQFVTSLDFLSSLKRINGSKLYKDQYSVVINGMMSLQTLFTPEVTENLKIDKGAISAYENPVLCVNEIEKVKKKIPLQPTDGLDIPQGMNGYSGTCKEVIVDFRVIILNETSVMVKFEPVDDLNLDYSVLYLRVPEDATTVIVPESCSEEEWFAVSLTDVSNTNTKLDNLRPGSTYAICIESYHANETSFTTSRSPVINFTTPIGKPVPPFITELVASSSDIVVLRWVNHINYKKHIIRYELDVSLIEIFSEHVSYRDHCQDLLKNEKFVDENQNPFKHAVVMKPPDGYQTPCESLCGVLSSKTKGEMIQENVSFCFDKDNYLCNFEEYKIANNSTTTEGFYKTVVLNISGNKNEYQVGNLAPYRDYRFRLRACTNKHCSISARAVVRTLASDEADKITELVVSAFENGNIVVHWEPPMLSNGPILAYAIFIISSKRLLEGHNPIPPMWCVPSHKRSTVIQMEVSDYYLVQVCTSSLNNILTCTEWTKFIVPSSAWVWGGLLVGMLLCVGSAITTYFVRKAPVPGEFIPLIEETSFYRNESEPSSTMMADFAPILLEESF